MLLATILDGRVETSGPIPRRWEGMTVEIVPVSSNAVGFDEDLTADELERRLLVFRDLGPMEYEGEEREQIAVALKDVDRVSREQVARQVRDAST